MANYANRPVGSVVACAGRRLNIEHICLLCLLVLSTIGCADQKEFNSEAWKSWIENEATRLDRWHMHHDLLEKYELESMNEIQVLDLLGAPERISENQSHYYLGMTGSGINTGQLTITYDDARNVIQVAVHQG